MLKYKEISDLIDEAMEALQNVRSAVEDMAIEAELMKASLLLEGAGKVPESPSDGLSEHK